MTFLASLLRQEKTGFVADLGLSLQLPTFPETLAGRLSAGMAARVSFGHFGSAGC
jgi:hypothetical protein